MDRCRALEYVDIAAQTEPASVFNAFLRLKVHLLEQDSKAAGDQIKAMLSCEDFSHEILRVSLGCAEGSCMVNILKPIVQLPAAATHHLFAGLMAARPLQSGFVACKRLSLY